MAERRMSREEFYQFAWLLSEPCGDGMRSCSRGTLSREAPERLSLGRRTVQELMSILVNWKARTKAGATSDELILLIDPGKVSKSQPPPARESRPPVTSDEAVIDEAVMKDIRKRGTIFKTHGVLVSRMTNPVVKIGNKLTRFSRAAIQASIERLLVKGELRRYQGTADTVEADAMMRTGQNTATPVRLPLVLPKPAPLVHVVSKPPPPPLKRIVPVSQPKKECIEMPNLTNSNYLFGFLLPHEERIWQYVLDTYAGDDRISLAYEQFGAEMTPAAFANALGRFAIDKILVEDATAPGTFLLGIKPENFGFRPNPRRILCSASVETMALVKIIQNDFSTIQLAEGYGFKKPLYHWYDQRCLTLPGGKARDHAWVDGLVTGYGEDASHQPPYGPLGLVMLWEGKYVRTGRGLCAVEFREASDPTRKRNKFEDLPFPTDQVKNVEKGDEPEEAPVDPVLPKPEPHVEETGSPPAEVPVPPLETADVPPAAPAPVDVTLVASPSSTPAFTEIDAQLAQIEVASRVTEEERSVVAAQIAMLSAKQTEIEVRQLALQERKRKLLSLQARTHELEREYLEKLRLIQEEYEGLLGKDPTTPAS